MTPPARVRGADHEPPPALLAVDDLRIDFPCGGGVVHAVRGVSWTLAPGEVLAVVGESGAGKSATALALLGLLPPSAQVRGSVRLDGLELVGLAPERLNAVRGARLALIPQDPLSSLNPVSPLGHQVADAVRVHDRSASRRAAAERAVELLALVGIGDARRRLGCYPHELSGGMRQRVLIAMALAHDPEVIVADEPTSALDVTVAAQVLETLARLRAQTGAAMVLITHDLGVVASVADRVLVMQAGVAAETGSVEDIFSRPRSPDTRRLLAAVPRLAGSQDRDRQPRRDAAKAVSPVLTVRDLVTHLALPGQRLARRPPRPVHAVCGVSFELSSAKTLGLVGESGSGKSTLARSLLGLVPTTSGTVRLDGRKLTGIDARRRRALATDLQIVFQDASASLDPRMPVDALVAEPLRIHGGFDDHGPRLVRELLATVGLGADHGSRYRHQLSGGERQRVGIARALALEPKVLVLDEPVSSLDLVTRAALLRLLADLQDRRGLAYLFIAHDLAVVRHLADEVAVMYLGKLVETGPAAEVYSAPAHPYTEALLSAVPCPDPRIERVRRRIVLAGEVPDACDPPSGCRFRTRCPRAQPLCAEEEPALVERGQGHPVACHFAG
jgi:peptide/nickel transport system ATP-binding protein